MKPLSASTIFSQLSDFQIRNELQALKLLPHWNVLLKEKKGFVEVEIIRHAQVFAGEGETLTLALLDLCDGATDTQLLLELKSFLQMSPSVMNSVWCGRITNS